MTAMLGERPSTCSIIALKMNPTAFIVPFVTKFEANPAIVTKLLAFCFASLSRQSTCSNGELTMSTFNLAHYPASEVEGLGISDHTDWELFTLLYPSFYPIQYNVPCYTGLEVWFEDKWVSVPHLPGN